MDLVELGNTIQQLHLSRTTNGKGVVYDNVIDQGGSSISNNTCKLAFW